MIESTLRDDVRGMEFPHQRHVFTNALETQGLDASHQAHMRVNSLSSKGSSSDFSVLRTPQDSLLSDNDAVIKEEHVTASWQTSSIGLVQEQITASPVEELSVGLRNAREKPLQMQINTSFTQRPRPPAFSAHPSQRSIMPSNQGGAGPRSATAAFPPMLLPSPARPQTVSRPDASTAENAASVPSAPAQSQHRRTQSAPLLSLGPTSATNEPMMSMQPATQHVPAGFRVAPTIGTEVAPPSYASLSPAAAANAGPVNFVNPAGRPFAAFTPFPTLNAFHNAGQAVPAPVLWPYYPPQAAAPRAFFPTPQIATPSTTLYSSPAPVTWKVINPNSQPQMPLSHLIGQANGMILGGPSAHNRKIGLYKTEICRNWEEKQSCRYGVKCQFAHGPADIRTVPRHPKYKTEICRTFWVTGSCPYGKRCCFIHPSATSAGNQMPPGNLTSMEDTDRETQHAISLLARLDLKRENPETPGGARQTPDTDVSDPTSFVYPGMGSNEAIRA